MKSLAWRPVDEADVEAWVRRGRGVAGRLEQVSIAIVRHAPGKRLTARCRLVLAAADGSRERLAVFAKQYARLDLAQRLARQLRTLRFAPGDGPVRVPKLLGLDARRGIVFLEALPGTSFDSTVVGGPARALEPAGALLAAFHRASATVEKRVTRAGELARTRECAQAIAEREPALAAALARVLRRLARLPWPRGRRALLHGSFRPNHLLDRRGALALLDLESLRTGPAAYDLANWIAALHFQEVVGRISAAARRRAVRALVRGYRAHGGDAACASVHWLTAALLVQKQAYKLATRPPGGADATSRARTRALVVRAERLALRAQDAGLARLERLERELA